MNKEEYQNYLQTDHWKTVANAVKERAGFRCQVCNSSKNLEAHHRTYENIGNELEHLGDLTCLCRRCHGTFHFAAKLKRERKPRKTPEQRATTKITRFFRRAAERLMIRKEVLHEMGQDRVRAMLLEQREKRDLRRRAKKKERLARKRNALAVLLDKAFPVQIAQPPTEYAGTPSRPPQALIESITN